MATANTAQRARIGELEAAVADLTNRLQDKCIEVRELQAQTPRKKPYKPPIDEELEAAGYVKDDNGRWCYPDEPDVYADQVKILEGGEPRDQSRAASDPPELPAEPEFLEFDRGGSLMGNLER